jgi:hypothetical protein
MWSNERFLSIRTTMWSNLLRFAAVSSAATAIWALGVGLLLRDVCDR